MKKTTTETTAAAVETKAAKVEPTTKVCKVCGKEKPIEDFRKHKSGYRLGKCYECEKAAWQARPKKAKKVEPEKTTFDVTTKSGQTFQVSVYPIPGGRKVSSPATDKVIYTPADVTRDQARAIFQAYANVPRTGITAAVVV
jgi:hypothetical protein